MKIIQTEHVLMKMYLSRLIYTSSGAQNLTEITRHDVYCTVIFPNLKCAYNRRYKIGKVSMHLSNLNSTGSSTRFMYTKFLPELIFYHMMPQ